MWKLPNAVHLQDKDSTSQSCAFLALTVSGLFGSYTHGKHKIKVIKFSTNRNFSHFSPFKIVIGDHFQFFFILGT